jgi:hypothetical protein
VTDYAIILGCPRSGTTFLMRALQPLDGAEVVSGLIYPPEMAHLAATSTSAELDHLLDRSLRFSLEFFRDHVLHSRGWAAGEWLKRNLSTPELVATLRDRRAIRTVVYKEPFLAFAPEFAARALPGTRVVHIHRDGRDCADSLERKYGVLTDEKLASLDTTEAPLGRKVDHRYVPWWVGEGEEDEFLAATPYLRGVWMWKEMFRRCADAYDGAPADRVLTVRYEELMRDPQAVGASVARFLGHEPNRGVRQRLGTGHTKSIGVHRRRDAAEVARATELAARELERFGYT